MTTINDAILAATGGPTVNGGLATYYGKTVDESLDDAEYRWLIEQGATAAQINDMWIDAFGPGQINDVKLAYWSAQTAGIAVPNVVGQTQVAATATITGAGLTLGTVTGTVDPVAGQDPIAGTIVAPLSAVNIVMAAVAGIQVLTAGQFSNVDKVGWRLPNVGTLVPPNNPFFLISELNTNASTGNVVLRGSGAFTAMDVDGVLFTQASANFDGVDTWRWPIALPWAVGQVIVITILN